MLMAIACAIKCDAQFVDIPFAFYELSRFKGSSEGSLSVYQKGKIICQCTKYCCEIWDSQMMFSQLILAKRRRKAWLNLNQYSIEFYCWSILSPNYTLKIN